MASSDHAVVAMILNGLGFTNRRLYLTHQFFETKPVERLLDADIKAEDITDYTLGHTLAQIWEYGSSKLFGEVAPSKVVAFGKAISGLACHSSGAGSALRSETTPSFKGGRV